MISKLLNIINRANSKRREVEKEKSRSPHWAHVRDGFLKEHPTCAACGASEHLQVHHVKPFHLHPELELDVGNLITLCMDESECHLSIGHGGSFKMFNPNVLSDSASYKTADKSTRKTIVETAHKNRLK